MNNTYHGNKYKREPHTFVIHSADDPLGKQRPPLVFKPAPAKKMIFSRAPRHLGLGRPAQSVAAQP